MGDYQRYRAWDLCSGSFCLTQCLNGGGIATSSSTGIIELITPSATVGWRDRLLGAFRSPYQPTEASLFHEMLEQLKIDFSRLTFIDLGSGKGRVLLIASNYSFRRIIGLELLPALHSIAVKNVKAYKNSLQQCFALECVLGDALDFVLPAEATVLVRDASLKRVGGTHQYSVLASSTETDSWRLPDGGRLQ